MFLDEHREVITSNVFDIPQRIKELDPKYFIVRNHTEHCFEVHWGEPKEGFAIETFQLSIPYKELDERTLKRVWDTRIENAKKILEEMEANNLKIELEAEKRQSEITREVAKDYYKYCAAHESKDAPDDEAYKAYM